MSKPQSNSKLCPHCQAKTPPQALYCSQCGRKLISSQPPKTTSPGPKHVVVLLLATLGIWSLITLSQENLVGQKPNKEFTPPVSHPPPQESLTDPALDSIRKKLDASPDDPLIQEELAQALLAKIDELKNPPPPLVLEAIEVLGVLLDKNPQNSFALLNMGNISFDQQVFPKAVEFYARYLSNSPDDSGARTRYASALAFVGQGEQALKELTGVIQKEPENFGARAYLSITYAHTGDFKKALESGQEALSYAPNDEAKQRFTRFLEDVKQKQTSQKNSLPPATSASDPIRILEEQLRAQPISGPKFHNAQIQESPSGQKELILFYKDFPMEAMPQPVKEKFLGGIKEKIGALFNAPMPSIILMDYESGKVLARL